MGDDGDAAGLVDQLDRLRGGRPAARHEGLGAGHQVLLEEGAEVAGRPRRLGDVRAADRVGGAGLADRVLERQVEALPAQVLDDLPGPGAPLLLGPLAGRRHLLQVDPVAADVQVFGVLVNARHLDRRHQLDPQPLRRRRGLRDPGDRVVVGQRQRRNPRLRSFLDHLGGRQLPVRNRRMTLQLDQHRRRSLADGPWRGVVNPSPDPLPLRSAFECLERG